MARILARRPGLSLAHARPWRTAHGDESLLLAVARVVRASHAERAALEYADAVTLSDRAVTDNLFARVRRFYELQAACSLTWR